MITALEALDRLREGNRRFVAGDVATSEISSPSRRDSLVSGQAPFAIILGCSDSRVPAEIVFHQGLGDLFVIRVAGNVVAASQVGSVEFAAERFGTRLVVVLGHTQCGAIQATVESFSRPDDSHSHNLRSIVDRVRPSVEPLMHTDLVNRPDELMHQAGRANILAAANQLRHGSQLLEKLIERDGLLVVGAEYALETGAVDFFHGAPPARPA